EQLAGAFAIASGDNGGMNVNETAILKKLVSGERESATHTKYATEKTRPGTQVRDLAHEFGGMSFLLERVGIVGSSYDLYPVRTPPWTRIASIGAVLCSASLIGVAESCVILNRATPNVQRSTLLRKATTVAGAQLRSNACGELTRLDGLATRIPRESIAVSPL